LAFGRQGVVDFQTYQTVPLVKQSFMNTKLNADGQAHDAPVGYGAVKAKSKSWRRNAASQVAIKQLSTNGGSFQRQLASV
jgi:hypothetical protein